LWHVKEINMKNFGVNQLRKMFLDFFESKDHLIMDSFSLVPRNDKSLLLINAGMAPFKTYFTGQEVPPSRRVATCQKSIRTGDIENVGRTARHLTFFEMLGNFSFGDYFKSESLRWTWEFLTEHVGLDADRLYPSIYYEDEESYKIWTDEINIPADRIYRFYRDENGDCDNFWEHGAGPCGPCSEVYYDRGEKYGCGSPGCTVGCDCDRYIEVWNNVFTQYESDGRHHYVELATKNIDTGMGLERLAVVVQDAESVYEIDTMKAIRDHVCVLANAKYKEDEKKDVSIRLITDHIRSVVFMASDGILPSNEGRGYVFRRLLRRAARHGRLVGIDGLFMARLCDTVIRESMDGYPELDDKRDYIKKILTIEEEKFNKTIDQGITILNEMIEGLNDAKSNDISNGTELSGEDAFKLYDTFGFPIDLTQEIAAEKGITIDMKAFDDAMSRQRETARSARTTTNYMGADATVYDDIDVNVTSEFVGYVDTERVSFIRVLTTDTQIVDEVARGQAATVITDETPFYATMGGQAGDIGVISKDDAIFTVNDTIKLKGGKVGHVGVVKEGAFLVGDIVTLSVDRDKRGAICKNHSATHLLHEALRRVLGSHVEQAGSLVAADRLRFDFTHFSAMTDDEVKQVEDMVNTEIKTNTDIDTKEMSVEDAMNSGARALFGEKYGGVVRVVAVGEFSKELCGGTHVANTGAIDSFKILSESGIAAGVRRIEAITADSVYGYYKSMEEELGKAAIAAKTEPFNLVKRIESMHEEIRVLRSENEKLKAKLAGSSLDGVLGNALDVDGIKVLSARVTEVEANNLRTIGDQLRDKLGECAIFLASVNESRVSLLAMATDGAISRGVHAGNIVKAVAGLVGGGGGGSPNMAQAGGKNPEGVDKAVERAVEAIKGQMKP